MFSLRSKPDLHPLLTSSLYDQDSFYDRFFKDLQRAQDSVIIESPFITSTRACQLLQMLSKLTRRGVSVIINTRDPSEHDADYNLQAQEVISHFQEIGVTVLYTVKHHRKLAVIDDQIMWEGSLNIMSFSNSCEIMRRVESPELCQQLLQFTGLYKFRW